MSSSIKSRQNSRSGKARAPRKASALRRGSLSQLHQQLSRLLPRVGLPVMAAKQSARWSKRMLVFAAILFTLDVSQTLADRFAAAYDGVAGIFPSRRRPGKDPQGFLRALCRHSAELLERVTRRLRRRTRLVAGRSHWRVGRWLAFGVDGSRVECRRSAANERAMGCAGREKTGPQLFVTTLFHMGTGLIWDFRRGAGNSSERSHLLQMLDTLPAEALLLADAGFTGYDFMATILAGGRHFLIRVGSNVTLLRKLGWRCREDKGTVYLWPEEAQRQGDQPPLALRLITLSDGRNRKIHLLTDVLQESEMSDREAGTLYATRWGVEVLYRSLKQTLGRRKMVCGNPDHAAAELDWAMVSLWGLSLMAAEELSAAGKSPARLSVAKALRPVRRAIRSAPPRLHKGLTLARELSMAVQDEYERKRPKRARNPVNKKRPPRPRNPKARMATRQEIACAKALFVKNKAA